MKNRKPIVSFVIIATTVGPHVETKLNSFGKIALIYKKE
jgi:hypothetical protein